METTLIPVHIEGKQNDLVHSLVVQTRDEAVDCFKRDYKRLLNPKTWHELGGIFSGEFVLVNDHGEQLNRLAQVGDLYRIDLPGPGSGTGDGYDWVRVDAIEDYSEQSADEELFAIR